MIVANEKRKSNVAEYILYMWQVESIIRSYNLNKDLIQKEIISQYQVEPKTKEEITEWYYSLINMMKAEGKEKAGHILLIQNMIDELYDLHLRLMKNPEELEYIDKYNKAKRSIDDLVQKTRGNVSNEIEACLNGLYGLMLLKLKKKEISQGTLDAMNDISALISLLSYRFHQLERGELEI